MNEAIKNLESRIAQLDKRSGRSQGTAIIEKLRKDLIEQIPYYEEYGEPGEMEIAFKVMINYTRRQLANLVLEKIRDQLDQIKTKTKKERVILNRLAPDHFDFGWDGTLYQSIRKLDNKMWTKHEVFYLLDRFKTRLDSGRYKNKVEEMTNYFLDEAVKACRELGI